MGANIPTGNDEEYSEIVAENIKKGKSPTYLELDGIEVSEYPSAGISVGDTIIFNKDRDSFYDSIDNDVSSFDIIVEYNGTIQVYWYRRSTIFISGNFYNDIDYGNILNEMSNIFCTMQKIIKQKLRVVFFGIGDGRLLYTFHRFGCACYGHETDAKLLHNAREMLNNRSDPWNFS